MTTLASIFIVSLLFHQISAETESGEVFHDTCAEFNNTDFDDVQLYHFGKHNGVKSSFTDPFFDAVCKFGITHDIDIHCPDGLNDEKKRDCICDKTVGSLQKHHAGTIIMLFVEETLGRYNQHVCNYTAFNRSPLFLQVFAGGVDVNEFALVSLASPAGHASFQIRKEHFKEHFLTVLNMVRTVFNSNLVHYNTARKNEDIDYETITKSFQAVQAHVEESGTPVAYVHLGLGIVLMIVAMLVGYITTDQSVLIKFEVTEIKSD
uniref:Uncharacterized protein n=1 Tax=Panagrellus redivivus TaxID=6233 RepID=A0A7E4W829_PANRE